MLYLFLDYFICEYMKKLSESGKLHYWSAKDRKQHWCNTSNCFLKPELIESVPCIKIKCISVDALTLHHLSNILDLLSQITSYFTLQSLKKHHFKRGHMEKCTSITSEGLAFSCKALSPKWLMCLERVSIWSYGNGEEQMQGKECIKNKMMAAKDTGIYR